VPTSREQQIATLYTTERDHLIRLVARHVHNVDEQTLEDACAHAWTQLLHHPSVRIDTRAPHRILRWLTTTATRHAWHLCETQRKTDGVCEHDLCVAAVHAGTSAPSPEVAVLQRDRLDLVRQLPERPRRFLLRLMLGYSYEEIAILSRAAVVVVGSALGTLVGDMSSTASAAR
jgi:DNA-directed RNA polymerase specialized sigma24 family protein